MLLFLVEVNFVAIFQGSRWLEVFLLLGSRSQVHGVLPHWSSLQDQTHLTAHSQQAQQLAIRNKKQFALIFQHSIPYISIVYAVYIKFSVTLHVV